MGIAEGNAQPGLGLSLNALDGYYEESAHRHRGRVPRLPLRCSLHRGWGTFLWFRLRLEIRGGPRTGEPWRLFEGGLRRGGESFPPWCLEMVMEEGGVPRSVSWRGAIPS